MAEKISPDVLTEIPIDVPVGDLLSDNQIHLKVAIGLDGESYETAESKTGPFANIAKPSSKKSGLRRWERITLAILASIFTGFCAGAGLAFLILDGKLDVNKKDLKVIMEILRSYLDH